MRNARDKSPHCETLTNHQINNSTCLVLIIFLSYIEIYLDRLNFDVSEDSSLLLDIIERAGFVRASEISSSNGLSLSEITDLRPGSTMIEIDSGQATLTMEVEQSDDLGVWTNGSATSIQIPIDAEAGKKFFRFKMAE